jgi:hypothetical protein
MSIGLGARTPGGQHLDIVHSMAATWCLGPLSDSRSCPGPVLKLNTVGWQMRLLRVAGFVNYFMSLVMVCGSPLLSSATMLVRYTWLAIRFIISRPNTLRYTFILFTTRCHFGKFQVLNVPS